MKIFKLLGLLILVSPLSVWAQLPNGEEEPAAAEERQLRQIEEAAGDDRDVGAYGDDFGVDESAVMVECGEEFGGAPGALKKIVEDVGGANQTTCYGYQNWQLQKVRNPLGHITTFMWDSLQRLQQVNDPLGSWISYHYDDQSRLQQIRHPVQNGRWYGIGNGIRTEYRYDQEGEINQIDYAPLEGAVTASQKILRHPDGMINAAIAPGNSGSCVHGRDAAGRVTTKRFDHIDPGTGACQNALGEETYRYNSNTGLLERITDASGNKTIILERDPFGRVAAMQMPEGQKIKYEYNKAGLLKKRELISQVEEGRFLEKITFAYDRFGRNRAIIPYLFSPEGGEELDSKEIVFTYDDSKSGESHKTIRIPGVGRSHLHNTFIYDGVGRLKKKIVPEEPEERWTYRDNHSQVHYIKRVRPQRRTIYYYDPMKRLQKVEFPGGSVLNWDYDSRGIVTQSCRKEREEDLGLCQRFYSDELGRIRKIDRWSRDVGAPPITLSIADYDVSSNLTHLKQDDESQWQFTYDAKNWLQQSIDPMGKKRTIARREARGYVVAEQDANWTDFNYYYDKAGRLQKIDAVMSDGREYHREFEYDARGNLKWVGELKGPSGLWRTIRSRGVLSTRWDYRGSRPHPIWVELETDSWGRTLEETLTYNTRSYSVTSDYNKLDLAEEITYHSGVEIGFDYSSAGKLRKIEAFQNTGANNPLWYTRFHYDTEQGHFDSLTHSDGSTTELFHQDVGEMNTGRYIGWQRRDAEGNAVAEGVIRQQPSGLLKWLSHRLYKGFQEDELTVRQEQPMIRDNYGRLRQVAKFNWDGDEMFPQSCEDMSECMVWDDRGNLSFYKDGGQIREMEFEKDNRLKTLTGHGDCDDMDPLTGGSLSCERVDAYQWTFHSDNNGNLIEIRSRGRTKRRFTYDPWSRLEKVQLFNHYYSIDEGEKNVEIRFEYDGLNRLRVRRTFLQNGNDWDFEGAEVFFWRGSTLVGIYSRSSGGRGSSLSSVDFVNGVGGSPMAAISGGSDVFEHLRRPDGSLVGLLGPNGEWEQWYKYSTVGRPIAYGIGPHGDNFTPIPVGERPQSLVLFQGLFYDPVTGYNYDGRWFDPKLGHYLTRDPNGPSMGNMNLYQYVAY